MLNLGRGTADKHLEFKAAGLYQLLRGERFPDLVALTELWGRAGQKKKVDSLFRHLVDEYDIYYSLRSVQLSKDAAATRADGGAGVEEAALHTTVMGSSPSGRSGNGGGIALLVHKRMCVNVRQRPFDDVALDDNDRALLDGHLRCYRLDPDVDKLRRRASVRGARANHASLMPLQPIIVTVGYAPPEGTPWGKATREVIFSTLVNVHKDLHALRQEQKVFVMALVHTNAPDGGIDLELPMRGDDRGADELMRELARAPQCAETRDSSTRRQSRRRRHAQRRRAFGSRLHNLPLVASWRARLTVLGDGTRRLHRAYSTVQRANTTPRGCELSLAMAAAGMVPTSGVQSYAQNDSWQPSAMFGSSLCTECAAGRSARCMLRKPGARKPGARIDTRHCRQRLKMHSVHDLCWVPDDLVWRALVSPTGGKHLLQAHTRRILWSTAGFIDHAVLAVRAFVQRQQSVVEQNDALDFDGSSTTSSTALRIGAGNSPDSASSAAPTALRRQPPAFRFPDNLLSKHIELQGMARLQNELAAQGRYAALRDFDQLSSQVQLSDPDIDVENNALVQILLESQDDAKRKRAERRAPVVEQNPLRSAKTVERAASQKLSRALQARESNDTPERRQAVTDAAEAQRVASKVVRQLESVQHASNQTRAFARAPLAFWSVQAEMASDSGAPQPGAVPLLVEQHDSQGRLKCVDRKKCEANIVNNRKQMYSMPSDDALGAAAVTVLVEAAACMSVTNRELLVECPRLGGSPDSAVSKSAREPFTQLVADAPGPDAGAKRARLHAKILAFERERCPAAVRGDLVRAQHPRAYAQLNRDIERLEVLERCNELEDVSPGTDIVSPGVLRAQTDDALLHRITHLFLTCQATGTQPNAWKEHRNVLLYKGKGTDPYDIGNYRGLGIDHSLGKLWALVWAERVEVFLRETNGLSVLQGGFQRQRGPPEQAFTLAETVRATIVGDKGVHLVFLDVKEAYDSVLHSVLWQRCVEKGFGGSCLAALQEMYCDTTVAVDVAGNLLGPVPIRRGVLQGNPLSPALFNIYLDGAIERLEQLGRKGVAQSLRPLGIFLPRVSGSVLGKYAPLQPDMRVAQRDQAEFLPCLFFADDGVLLDTDIDVMQKMLLEMVQYLAEVGLRVHPTKTKWMYVPPAGHNEQQYLLAVARFRLTPLLVNGLPIKLVDSFTYLGVEMGWRWNWALAWNEAQSRARKAYFGARRGGWQHRSGSMASQLTYAQGKIFCHFNYVAAIAGAGGCKTSAPWRKNEDVVAWTLRTIAQLPGGDATALAIEAGVWDQETRIDMLLLRMWCKFLTMPRESTFVRAMCLSLSMLNADPSAVLNYADRFSAINHLHKQPWAQQLLAAVMRFGLDASCVRYMQHELVALQLVHNYTGDASIDVWQPATDANGAPTAAAAQFDTARSRCRVVATPHGWSAHNALNGARVEGESCWLLPEGVALSVALERWTPQLKDATYASLRTLGNACRLLKVRAFLNEQLEQKADEHGHRLRTWASSIGFSFLQAYWHLDDVRAARCLLRMRFDMCPTEDYLRRRPIGVKPNVLQRLPNPGDRSCYCCRDMVLPGTSVYWNETQAHVLRECSHPRLVSLRERFVADANALFAEMGTLAVVHATRHAAAAPDLRNMTALLTVMRLCIGVGDMPITTLVSAPARPARAAAQPLSAATLAHQATATARRMCDAPRYAHDHSVAAHTAAWSAALMDDWCDAVREPRRTGPIEATPGFRLAALVARYAQRVFDTRASLLNDERADEYRRRSRDPAPSVVSLVRPRPAVSVVRRAAAAAAAAAVPASMAAPPPPRS